MLRIGGILNQATYKPIFFRMCLPRIPPQSIKYPELPIQLNTGLLAQNIFYPIPDSPLPSSRMNTRSLICDKLRTSSEQTASSSRPPDNNNLNEGAIFRNRYVKFKKCPRRESSSATVQHNLFMVSPLVIQPKFPHRPLPHYKTSQKCICENNQLATRPSSRPAETQQFIMNFLHSHKSKINPKYERVLGASQQMLFYVKSHSSVVNTVLLNNPSGCSHVNGTQQFAHNPASTVIPLEQKSNTNSIMTQSNLQTNASAVCTPATPEQTPGLNRFSKQVRSGRIPRVSESVTAGFQASTPGYKTSSMHNAIHRRQMSKPLSSRPESFIRSSKSSKYQGSISSQVQANPALDANSLADTIQRKFTEERKNRPVLSYEHKQLGHIKSESFAVIQHPTGQLILHYRSKQALEIASLTKIMTCYTIIKLCEAKNIDMASQNYEVKVLVEDVTGTSADLIEGDILNIQQLLYGLMLPSGNDAAICLADWGGELLSGSKNGNTRDNIKLFVQQMNNNCKLLGLKDSRYGNPHGLPHRDTRSTALDQCKLSSICMSIPLFSRIVKTLTYKFMVKTSDKLTRQVLWQNTNKLLRRPGFLGIKTGITVTAGPCLASCYEFKNMNLIVVLLRSNKVSRRFSQTRKLLYWTLKQIFKGRLSSQESHILDDLRRNRREHDSDNSEDEQEFIYSKEGGDELARRNKILKYQL